MNKEYAGVIAVSVAVIILMIISMSTPSSIYFIGECFKDEQDMVNAEKFYKISAERGYAKAQFSMSVLYASKNDYKEAIKWGQMAAENGLVEAQHNMGIYYIALEGDHPDASSIEECIKWLSMAAEKDFDKSYYPLGMCYIEKGDRFDKKNSVELFKKGYKYICKAAETGNERALAEKGKCLLIGCGTDKNSSEAYKIFDTLSNKEDIYGLYFKALCLSNGEGVERDLKKALEVISKALEKTKISKDNLIDIELFEKIKKLDIYIKEQIQKYDK